MANPLNVVKDRLTHLNESFINTIEHHDTNLNNEKKPFVDSRESTRPNDDIKKFYKNGNEYMNKFDNIEKREEKPDDLTFVTPEINNISIIDPSYLREKNFEHSEKYINVSFVNDLIKVSKDEIRSGQKDFYGGKYNFNYNSQDKKANYEFINATNEYYITKNVEEKMANTGITTENFFSDNSMLLYEDSMNKWSDKSRYLYFIDKEKENDGEKKKSKFKNIHLNDSLILDRYEKRAYKQDVSSDKVKIENLILDVLNNNFDIDMESEERKIPKETAKSDKCEDVHLEIKKKEEKLNITKKEKIKDTRNCNLDYLHYHNYFQDDDLNFSEKSTSDDSEHNSHKNSASVTYVLGNEEEYKIKNNVNNLLTKVKKDLCEKDLSQFIPEKFNMDIFLRDGQTNSVYESASDDNESVLIERKILLSEKKRREEMELLEKYNYVDHLYSPGYCTHITQNLSAGFGKKKFNIYELKRKKLHDKMKEDIMEEKKMKKEEENLRKLRFENLQSFNENLTMDHDISVHKDHIPLSKKKIVKSYSDAQNNLFIDDVNEHEESYKTDSSLSYDNIDSRSIANLKKKYKAMKKSNNVFAGDLRKLKFYICRKLNKKKYFIKPQKTVNLSRKKKENIKKVMHISKQGGYNLLAKLQQDFENNEESEEETDIYEEKDLFDNSERNTDDFKSSEYTYSSLTISSYEYLNMRNVYYNDNSYEKIFYYNDPKMNVTYLCDRVEFFLINNDKRTNKGILFMEILVFDILFYENSDLIEEKALLYSLQINENTIAEIQKKDNDIYEIILETINNVKDRINCCLSGNRSQINILLNNIKRRILLDTYIKYVRSASFCVIENAVNYFLFERNILNLKNVKYDKKADTIICSYNKYLTNINSINLSNRNMTIEDLSEFLSFSNIKQCDVLNLANNPLFSNLIFNRIKKDMDYVIKFFKSIKLKELILDFINFSNPSSDYFISDLLLNTEISFLSLVNCQLRKDNVDNLVKYIKERKTKSLISPINCVNVEFNKLTYYDILSLTKILFELNKSFKMLYIYGNLIQTDIFDISYEFKRKKSSIIMQKYFKPVPDIFHFNNIYEIKKYFSYNLRGIAELLENDKSTSVVFELYFCYLYIEKPEEKLYIIKNITIKKLNNAWILFIECMLNKKETKIELNLFKNNIILLFNNIVKKSFRGELYFYEQMKNNREINENVLNYFVMRNESDINFYHYNVTHEEIHFVLDLCKNSVVKNINFSCCYLSNEDILYFNSVKDYSYDIKVYKLSLSNNLIDSNLPVGEIIAFLSNFTIFFNVNLRDLNLGGSPLVHELFFYLLNDTKCKIVNLDNCKLTNTFLLNVNKNINKLNKNTYLTVLSLQCNLFNNNKGIITFLNNIISKCRSLEKIKLYSNYLSAEDANTILFNSINKDIISFQCTYDSSMSDKNELGKTKVTKLAKNKINKDTEYNAYLTEVEQKLIENFFEKQQNKDNNSTPEQKEDFLLKGRYNLTDLKSRNIKYHIMK
ncbi:hypothetical protein PMALA_023420 [Plasmodium malariae]|uniref:Leucine-rich repeat protein n=1 Tax=Plasmodium malariae TaxID=5858 RepID=A0A1A8W794_PLAMA|nr:hypothetical protein PMALA_023420 [Plasmodium malariae]